MSTWLSYATAETAGFDVLRDYDCA
jgi:hypothetical protein